MTLEKLVWNDEYLTGVESIDKQHKEIVEEFNIFLTVIHSGDMNEAIFNKMVESLDSYTTTHFETEENYMLENNFSGYKEHKARHEFFKSIYKEIRENKFFSFSTSHMFALHLAAVASEWLEIHIKTYDKELADFLKSKNIK